MSDAVPTKLQGALRFVWTIEVRHGDEEVRVPKFMPREWTEGGRLDEARFRILKAAGWHLEKLADGQNYLFPNDDLAAYALGWAADDYAELFPNRAEEVGKAKVGGYSDLTDAILYSEAMKVETTLPSGAKLFSPRLPDEWRADAGVAKNVESALNGGWVMVGLITEPDLFLLPPEAIEQGAAITAGDAKVGVSALLQLKRDGLISLRGKFGKTGRAYAGLTLPERVSRGGEWKLEDMVREQDARWGGEEIKPVVDLAAHKWLTRFPELREWLRSHAAYVEEFDLARIKFLVDAWGEIPDIGALSNIIGGIKGVMGEVAARQEIVKEYRISREPGDVLLVAPQIFDNRMLERSDAIVVNVPAGGDPAIKRAWEVMTDESGRPHAQEQMAASLEAYRTSGVILRRSDGKTIQFKNVTVSGNAGNVQVAQNGGIDRTLAGIREALVVELGLNLVAERVRSKFSLDYDGLTAILKEKEGAKVLIELLCEGREIPKRPVVVGNVGRDKKIFGLRVVSEETAKAMDRIYFRLVFDRESANWRIVSANGYRALDLAATWVEGMIGREIDVVERSYLAVLLGTPFQTQSGESVLNVSATAKHMKEYGFAHLFEIAATVGRQWNGTDKPVVAAHVQSDGRIYGLRIVGEGEIKNLPRGWACHAFNFNGKKWQLISIGGQHSLLFAVAWVEADLGRKIDAVEKTYLACLLGTQIQSKDGETASATEAVAKHIREYGLTRLLEIAAAVDKRIDETGKVVMVGLSTSDDTTVGLRIVNEKEAEGLSRFYFRLTFDSYGGRRRLVSATGGGSPDFAAAWIEGRVGRKIDVVERSYLTGLLGTHLRKNNLTIDVISEHIRKYGLNRLLKIAEVVGRPLEGDSVVVVGRPEMGDRVSGLCVVSEEEASGLDKNYFQLAFKREDENWRLISASHHKAKILEERIKGVSPRQDPGELGSTNVNVVTFGSAAVVERAVRLARHLNVAGRSPTGNALRGGITMPIGVAAAQVVERELEGGWRPHDWREELHAVMVAHPSGLAAGLTTGTAGQIAEAGALRLTGRQTAVLGTRVVGRLVSPAANLFLMSIFADFVVDGRLDITADEAARGALQMTAVTTATRTPLRAYRVVKAFRQGRRGLALASAAFTDGAGGALGLLLEETAFQVVDLSILATLSWYERHTVRRAFQTELKREMARFVRMRESGEGMDNLREQSQKIVAVAGTWKHFEEEIVPYAKLDAEKQLENSHYDEEMEKRQRIFTFVGKQIEKLIRGSMRGEEACGPSNFGCAMFSPSALVFPHNASPELRNKLKWSRIMRLSETEGSIHREMDKASDDRNRTEMEYANAREEIRKAFDKRHRPSPARPVEIASRRPSVILDAPYSAQEGFSNPRLFRYGDRSYALTEDQISSAIPNFSGDPANIFKELETFFRDQAMRAGEQVKGLRILTLMQ